MNKILFLGGKPIGSTEIVKRFKESGYYVIVTDFLTPEQSPAKLIADEVWNISTADVDIISEKAEKEGVIGVSTGVHEFNINRMLDICERLNLPTYCNRETWKYCDDKNEFKSLCTNNNIPVAKSYSLEYIREKNIGFPVIVKPVDGSGSRGFHICRNYLELEDFHEKAKIFSPTGRVLIEEYIPYNAVIIHYTMIDGKCIYSGMSDKISVKFPNSGASVMGIQTFPSRGEEQYLEMLDQKARQMFEKAGFKDGPIWIEAFFDGGKEFVFNEMGYRFGGSLTYYPVKYFTGIDQLGLYVDSAVGRKSIGSAHIASNKEDKKAKYCILPIHIKAGTIKRIIGQNELLSNPNINALVPVHFPGDKIEDWGSAQQVFAYLHILYSDRSSLSENIRIAFDMLQVLDQEGNNMIYTLFDTSTL